jgi:TatD DNase family protein
MPVMLVDTHCHLDFPGLVEQVPQVLARAEAAGVGRLVTIATHVKRFETYKILAESDPRIFFTIGTHPHQAGEEPDTSVVQLMTLSQHPRCIGLGEAGLDYLYTKSPKEVQKRVFRTHIAASRETGLPLVIHAREADDDMITLLEEEMEKGPFSGILHCFSSGERLALAGVEMGLHISFSGILTFKKSEALRALAAKIPIERLLVETDAPYLSPEPHRGKNNEPAFTAFTARTLAACLNKSEAELSALTTANFYRLFRKAAILDGVAL